MTKRRFLGGTVGAGGSAAMAGLGVLFGIVFAVSLLTGRYPAPGISSPLVLFETDAARQIFANLRLP
ncbi:MAG: hypothetical protein ACQETQ_11285, partial [Spirochaetota bacterium]